MERKPEDYLKIVDMPDQKTLEDFLIGGRGTNMFTLPVGVIFNCQKGAFERIVPEPEFDLLVTTYKDHVRNSGQPLGHFPWEV